MRHLLPVLALVLAGCPKKDTVDSSLTDVQLADSPRLPAPQAGSYARVPKTPKDPAVRAVIGERTWDESLAGAAAGLALNATQDEGGFTRREIREASWQAGYPWPILAMGTWPTSEGAPPPPALVSWTREQPAARDLGLVRARGQGRDLWVGLAGRELFRLGVVAREVASGTSMTLPQHAGATYRISDGNGAFREGDLSTAEQVVTFDVPGEWLIQVVDGGGDLARFPVYVDEEAPDLPVLPPRNINIDSKEAAVERVTYLLQTARTEYRNKAFFLDPFLNAGASDAKKKASDPSAVARRMAGERGIGIGAMCKAGSVEDCVDQMLWDARTRQAFVDSKDWAAGMDIAWSPNGVEIWALMIRQD